MDLRGLDLNLLIVLDALLAEKNITRTAQRINLTQPATSNALSRLRDFFGDQLLIQVGRRMELTPLAERLAAPVHEALIRCEEIIDKNRGFSPETSTRTFRLNMSDYEAAVIMNRAISRIRSCAPNVRVEISTIVVEHTRDYLERGYLDLIITPAWMTSPLHPSERLFDDQLVVTVWSGNPIAHEEMTPDRYLSMDHVVVYFGRSHNWGPDEVFFLRSGYQRHIQVVTSSFSMQLSQVIGTPLVATTWERFARFYAQLLPIQILPVPFSIPLEEIRLQWHRFQDNDPGIRWLRKVLRESAAELAPLTCNRSVKE